MALSWTGVARNYRVLQHNSILPSASITFYNANSSIVTSVNGSLIQNRGDTNLKSNTRGCSNARHYSNIALNHNRNDNTSSFFKSKFVIGCHKHAPKSTLVTEKRNFHKSSTYKSTRLTPTEATNILRKNEYTTDELWTDSGKGNSPVKSFDMNSIRSNNPTEDAHSEAIIRFGTTAPNGMLFGIFDGHGGAACGQVHKISINEGGRAIELLFMGHTSTNLFTCSKL